MCCIIQIQKHAMLWLHVLCNSNGKRSSDLALLLFQEGTVIITRLWHCLKSPTYKQPFDVK